MTPWGAVYVLVVLVLALPGLHRVLLIARAVRPRPVRPVPEGLPDERPWVTVQLPVYNEREVVADLVDAVSALRWPAQRLELQLLDDSDDDTFGAATPALDRARARGIAVRVLRRAERTGFKAGALAAGVAAARGELFAIFDADFRPAPDFLERLVPEFADPTVAMVQARWGHANADHNALTAAQAAMLDAHFSVEHHARFRSGLWIHFNGTAGVWRRAAIEAAGGWEGDTLTEDLDLSYRAQLAGWRLVYRDDVVVPAELPPTMPALLAQQRRWAKGSIETLRKLGGRIVRADVSAGVKLEALQHLTANLAWPLSVVLAVLLPVVVVRGGLGAADVLLGLPLLLVATGSHAAYFFLPGRARIGAVARALVLGPGLGVSQGRAVLEALAGRRSPFVRTAKGAAAATAPVAGWALGELALAAWLVGGVGAAVHSGQWEAALFLALFAGGYGWVGVAASRGRRPNGSATHNAPDGAKASAGSACASMPQAASASGARQPVTTSR